MLWMIIWDCPRFPEKTTTFSNSLTNANEIPETPHKQELGTHFWRDGGVHLGVLQVKAQQALQPQRRCLLGDEPQRYVLGLH